jgi:hypothetical protein
MEGHSSYLIRRFGDQTTNTIAEAYASAVGSNYLCYEQRLAMIAALIDEVEAGHRSPEHLKEVAQIFAPMP